MNCLLKNLISSKSILRVLFLSIIVFPSFYPNTSNSVKAGLEFQWDDTANFKKLKWYQKTSRKRAKNKIFFFLRPSDRKTGFTKINLKMPERFASSISKEKISVCKVKIGGFDSRTKCIEEISADIELNDKKTSLEIYPFSPIPSSKDSYAVVFKVINPQRAGLYQFHTFGQSSGDIPVSYYLGSYTVKIAGQ